MTDMLTTIFLESFARTMVFPIGGNAAFETMYWFGHAMTAPAAALALGALAGGLFNWMFGQVLAGIRRHRKACFPDARYERLGGYARRYGAFLLLFYWIPGGNLLAVAAGFFGLRWWLVAISAIPGTLLWLYLYFPAVFGGALSTVGP